MGHEEVSNEAFAGDAGGDHASRVQTAYCHWMSDSISGRSTIVTFTGTRGSLTTGKTLGKQYIAEFRGAVSTINGEILRGTPGNLLNNGLFVRHFGGEKLAVVAIRSHDYHPRTWRLLQRGKEQARELKVAQMIGGECVFVFEHRTVLVLKGVDTTIQ